MARRRKYYRHGVIYKQDGVGPVGCATMGCTTQGCFGCSWGVTFFVVFLIVVLILIF
jgi:hypothetical protein